MSPNRLLGRLGRAGALALLVACGAGADEAGSDATSDATSDGAARGQPREETMRVVDLSAHPLSPRAGEHGTLLVFVSPDCPISNAYAPTLRALEVDYAPRGIVVHRVYVECGVSLSAAESHGEEYDLPASFVRDPEQRLVAATGVSVTPEAALLNADGELVYRGRIDDLYSDLGTRLAEASRHDLRDALEALLAGDVHDPVFTEAIGCFLPEREPPHAVSRDDFASLAPLIHTRCAVCHHPGGSGPFSLLTHDDVQRRARQIRLVTERRLMPPWKPASGHGEFLGERRLNDQEVARLHDWLDAGAPLGDTPAPTPPVFSDDWQLGPPDLIVKIPESFEVPAAGDDVWRSFVAPTSLSDARFVNAVEFRVSNPRVTHHAVLHIDDEGLARAAAESAPGPGFPGMALPFYPKHGGMDGFVPGMRAQGLPHGLAWRLPPGADLVFEAHFQPTGKPEVASFEVGLHFAAQPPERALFLVRLAAGALNIRAGDADYVVRDAFTLPVDVQALAILPHAHRIARRLQADAIGPAGAHEPLVLIPDWDFDWQDVYRYREALPLEAGTRLEMEIRYDNSAGNPRQPSRPARRVVGGTATRDEMAFIWVQVSVAHEDLAELRAKHNEHIAASLDDYRLESLWALLVNEVDRDGDQQLDAEEEALADAFLGALPEQPELVLQFFDLDRDGALGGAEQAELNRFVDLWRGGER